MKQHEHEHEQRDILVVDDEPASVGVINGYLHEAGYQCSVASNGKTAIERAARIQPGVIVLDVNMPGMDGFEVCRRLKQIDSTRDIPVIFVTALDDHESTRLGFGAGGVDYITKPVWKEELLARVGTHLDNYLYKHTLEQAVKRRTAELEQANTQLSAEIDRRKASEEKLKETELRYRTVADVTYDWEDWIDPAGNYVYVSPSCERITGYHADEFVRNPDLLRSMIHPDDRSVFADHTHTITETGERLPIDFRIVTRSGEQRWIGHICQPVHSDDGRYLGQRGSNRDITARKQAEEALRESEQKYRLLTETMQDIVIRLSPAGKLLYVSPAIKKFGGYDPDIEIGSDMSKYFENETDVIRAAELLAKVLRTRQSGNFEFLFNANNKAPFPVEYTYTPIVKNGNVTEIQLVLRDITERKQAEEHIRASLKEKEVLLQEIHHRVKNNLQVISSLLDMSRMRTQDQQAIDLLTDARARIHIMALIHTQLYQSERFEQIDMDSHIRELVSYLSAVYAERKMVTPRVEVSGLCLSLIQAIPCALVLNELIANAFKHAFKEGQTGTLAIIMRQSPEGRILLNVNDNGIGIRDEIDLEHTTTMGLKLVRGLVQKQLRGEIQVMRNAGTEFVITFDIPAEKVQGNLSVETP